MARKSNENPKIAVKILQYFIIAICVAFILFVLSQQIANYLRSSSIFKVREVVANQSLLFIKSRTLDRLIGQSIFEVDLVLAQKRLQEEYPQIDRLRLYRQFPNRIYVDAIRRDPFALIVTKRQQILVDKDGIVLTLTPPPNLKLPIITGLDIDQVAVSGKPLRHSDLGIAVTIIKAVQGNPHLQSMPVVSLDLTNLSQIQCVLTNQLKVILAEDNIEQKIMMLGIFMSQGGIRAENINYVDLRFKEPIISKKDSNTRETRTQ